MLVDVKLEVDTSQVERLTDEMIGRLHEMAPVLLGPIADSIRATFRAIWYTQGGYAVGGWEPLAESTARRKGGSYRILVETDALEASLTEKTAWGHVEEMTDSGSLEIGTEIEYAWYHQEGTRNMPARPIAPDPWPEEDTSLWADLSEAYVIDGVLP